MARRHSKSYREALKQVDHSKGYSLAEAVGVLKKVPPAKFDETVELSIKLGVNPEAAGQAVRGTVGLPHGSGKKVRVAVFAKGEASRPFTES